jgi:formylglycine-generating enzyme required for sulfatase activity
MKKSLQIISAIVLSIAITFTSSCKKDAELKPESINGDTSSKVKANNSSNDSKNFRKTTTTSQEEIALITSKAVSVTTNSKGYTEAIFNDGIVMIYLPTGTFVMGNDDITGNMVNGFAPSPAHQVTLDHYWICKTPVTKGQFRAFVSETGYKTEVEGAGHAGPFVYDFDDESFLQKPGYYWDNTFKDITAKHPELAETDDHPVSCVSWNDAIAFTNWMATKTGLNFTLPTEAEWEYAARGTDERVYPWGSDVPDGTKCNYADSTFNKYFSGVQQAQVHKGVNDGYGITSPVLAFPAGIPPVGAYDMAGNLIEWVYDSGYDYSSESVTNPITLTGNDKLQKGGFWVGGAGRVGVTPNEILEGHNIRSDSRESDGKASADDHLGFRIGMSYTERTVVTSVMKIN